MATPTDKISSVVLHEGYPLVASILEAAKDLTARQWETLMREHPMVRPILSALGKVQAVLGEDVAGQLYSRVHVEKLAVLMGAANKEIAMGDTSFQPLLVLCGFPTQAVNCKGGVVKQLSFFPRKAKSRSIHVVADARARVQAELFDEPASALRVIKLCDMLTPSGIAALPVEMFDQEAPPQCAVQWHVSRRAAHCTSAQYCAGTLKACMSSDKAKLRLAAVWPKEASQRLIAGPKEEIILSVPCQLCCEAKVEEPHMMDVSMFACIDLFRKIAPDTPRNFWATSVAVAARRDRAFRVFTCPTEMCIHNESPFVFQETATCVSCVRALYEHATTHFHTFACPGCDTNPARIEACGLCCQPKSKHIGESMVCPKKDRPTDAQRALARSEGNNYCPCCDTVVSRITNSGQEDGCPKIQCPGCTEYFCGDCDKLLPVDPLTGSRYTHVCPTPRKGTAWAHVYHAPPAAAQDQEMLAAMAQFVARGANPSRHHRIGQRFGVGASTPMAAAPAAAGGGGAAPAADGGGGAAAAGGGGGAAPAADGGAAPAADGGAAAAGGGGGGGAPAAGGGGGMVRLAWVLEVNPDAIVDAAGNMWVAGVNVGREGEDW